MTAIVNFLPPGMDTGDILLEERTPIGPLTTTGDLWMPLAHRGAALLVKTLDQREQIVPLPQDHDLATHARMLKKEDGLLDWHQSAETLHNRVRGINPWPGAWTHFRGERLKIWKATVVNLHGSPGEVIRCRPKPVIGTGKGALQLEEIQLPGKRRGPAETLVHGARLKAGERLKGESQ